MNVSSPGSARNLKSQLLPMISPGSINGRPNDGCGAQISPSQTSLDTPPVAHLGQDRLSLLSDRDLICPLRQRRNDGSDSRQLSIQCRLQLLEGGLDFRWRPAIALIDEQSDHVIDLSGMVPVAILTSS
jgi:hypothetical protein